LIIFSQKCNAQLSGIFTVGGTSPDFATIQDAAFALIGGVSGPVTFNIRPGTYNGPIEIGYIPNANAVNRIIFQSENGDSSSVNVISGGSIDDSEKHSFCG